MGLKALVVKLDANLHCYLAECHALNSENLAFFLALTLDVVCLAARVVHPTATVCLLIEAYFVSYFAALATDAHVACWIWLKQE